MLYRSYQYRETTNWTSPLPPSSYQTTHFAQSVFQRTAPSTAYPTPPPPGINTSSSSLAYALGGPSPHPQPHHQPHPPRVYQPQESQAFYDDFLERKSRQMNQVPTPIVKAEPVRLEHARPVTPPPKAKQAPPEESPDPLALRSGGATRTMPSTSVTPQKRKPVVEIQVKSVKRPQLFKTPSTPSLGHQLNVTKTPQSSQSSIPVTPSSSATSFSNMSRMSVDSTPTHKRVMNLAYVAIPSKPLLTPASSRKGSHPDSFKRGAIGDTPDDLGGYGSEDGEPSSPIKPFNINDSVKSSARRTGDRDERGMSRMFK